jgi:branched-chain amino acid transport system permease protein
VLARRTPSTKRQPETSSQGAVTEPEHARSRLDGAAATAARLLLPIAVTAAILIVLPHFWFADSPYTTGLAVEALVFGCYAVGFNLIFGSTNQLFLCVGALAGVGGYATAILSDRASLPLAVGVAIGTLTAAIVGGLLAWIAVRRSLNVIFTGIVTLVFSLAFTNFIIGQRDLTGADTGYVLKVAATDLADDRLGGYYLFVGLLVGLLLVFRALQHSHLGWAFRALRDDEVAAELAGVDVARYRIYAAMVGSAMIGLTGGLFAYSLGFISPVTYGFAQVDVQVLIIVAFGGMGTLLGPVIGAAAFGFLDRALTDSGQLREAYYGAFVIAIFLFLRRGVVPTIGGLFDRVVASRRAQRMEGAAPGRSER